LWASAAERLEAQDETERLRMFEIVKKKQEGSKAAEKER
jgi:hypothetical protein